MSETETMVERVARALHKFGGAPDYKFDWLPGGEWEDIGENPQAFLKEIARAAIAAMRTPTDKMLDAMNPSFRYAGIVIPEAWAAAIDAALKE